MKDYEEISLEKHNQKDDDLKFYEKATNANSLSLQRMPALNKTVRGNTNFFPFKPASMKFKMDRELYYENLSKSTGTNSQQLDKDKNAKMNDIIDFDNFLTKPDKFENGLVNNQLTNEIKSMFIWSNELNDELVNDINQFKKESEIRKLKRNEEHEEQKRLRAAVVNISIKDFKDINYYDTNFVKVLNTDEQINDFDQLLPNPAKRFPFELDTFQKKAILCLEKKQNVLGKIHFLNDI